MFGAKCIRRIFSKLPDNTNCPLVLQRPDTTVIPLPEIQNRIGKDTYTLRFSDQIFNHSTPGIELNLEKSFWNQNSESKPTRET